MPPGLATAPGEAEDQGVSDRVAAFGTDGLPRSGRWRKRRLHEGDGGESAGCTKGTVAKALAARRGRWRKRWLHAAACGGPAGCAVPGWRLACFGFISGRRHAGPAGTAATACHRPGRHRGDGKLPAPQARGAGASPARQARGTAAHDPFGRCGTGEHPGQAVAGMRRVRADCRRREDEKPPRWLRGADGSDRPEVSGGSPWRTLPPAVGGGGRPDAFPLAL